MTASQALHVRDFADRLRVYATADMPATIAMSPAAALTLAAYIDRAEDVAASAQQLLVEVASNRTGRANSAAMAVRRRMAAAFAAAAALAFAMWVR